MPTHDSDLLVEAGMALGKIVEQTPMAPEWPDIDARRAFVAGARPQRRWNGPLVAVASAAVVLIGATMILYGGRLGTVQEGDSIAPGIQANVCDLFTEEEVTAIVRDVYLTNGIPAAELPTLLVEGTREAPDTHGDSCDWLAAGAQWVVLERIQDEQHEPIGFYHPRVDRTFEPNEAMPSGVEVANVLVDPFWGIGSQVSTRVTVDVQMVDDAPRWWHFVVIITSQDPGHRDLAQDIALSVASQMFETIQDNL